MRVPPLRFASVGMTSELLSEPPRSPFIPPLANGAKGGASAFVQGLRSGPPAPHSPRHIVITGPKRRGTGGTVNKVGTASGPWPPRPESRGGWSLSCCVGRCTGRIGAWCPYQVSRVAKLWVSGVAAVAVGYALKLALRHYVAVMRGPHSPLLIGPCVLIVFGFFYLALVHLLGVAMPGTLSRLLRGRR